MNAKGAQLAALVVAVAGIRELIVNPCVHWLHRKGVLRGPEHPHWLSLRVRWRNIGVFLLFCALWLPFVLLAAHWLLT